MTKTRPVGRKIDPTDRETVLQLALEGLSVSRISARTGISRNTIRSTLEKAGTTAVNGNVRRTVEHPQRAELRIRDGVVIVASDGHYWPGPASTTHRALVHFCRELRPAAFILNGDAFDGARISRHPPIGWEARPTVIEEIEAVQERLGEIEAALPRRAARVWCAGNHDLRFETRLATVAPEYANLSGIHLKDHFQAWPTAWSCFINDDVVVKHRFKGGLYAPANNSLWSGRTMLTGHLHSAKVQPITDYNGTRWGVDTGCVAEPDGPQFTDYREDGPANWVSAFAVLTFRAGRLLWPELVVKFDEKHVEFRGAVIRV